MRKGVLESNHRSWNEGIKLSLLECCISLASACAKGLASVCKQADDLWSPAHALPIRRADVVAEMLEALSWSLDPRSCFSETFQRVRIPSECLEKVHNSVNLVAAHHPSWTRAVAAKFQAEEGIQLIFEVRSNSLSKVVRGSVCVIASMC